MKNNELLNKVSRKMYRIGFKVQKHSPEILMGAGIVGAVTSAVMACKAIVSPPNVFHKDGIVEVRQETVGRYTGLTDRYGSMIFEGDLIRIYGCTYGQLLEVRFMDGLFVGYIEGQTPLWLPLFAKHIRVVDNLWYIKENSMLQSIESDEDAEDLCWEWD